MPAPSYGPEPYGAPAFILALAALGRLHFSAAFALRPLRIARGRRWCEHDYPRWGGHTTDREHCNFPVRRHRYLSWGRSSHGAGFRPFVANRNICNFLWYGVVEGGLRAKVLGRLGWRLQAPSKSVCSIAHRSLFIGRGLSGSGLFAHRYW